MGPCNRPEPAIRPGTGQIEPEPAGPSSIPRAVTVKDAAAESCRNQVHAQDMADVIQETRRERNVGPLSHSFHKTKNEEQEAALTRYSMLNEA